MAVQFRQPDQSRFPDQGYIDVEPTRIVSGSLGVEVFAFTVELRFVWISLLRNASNSCNARFRAARMVKEHLIPDAHLIAHEIARLIVAHAPPGSCFPWRLGQVLDAEYARLRLHQPIIHVFYAKKKLRASGTFVSRDIATVHPCGDFRCDRDCSK